MTTLESAPDESTRPTCVTDVDVLVIGAGITGIYQLYRPRSRLFGAAAH